MLIERLETNASVIVHIFSEDVISREFLNKVALHLQEVIKSTDIFVNMLFGEVVVIRLNTEVFVNFSLLSSEETFNFFDTGLL